MKKATRAGVIKRLQDALISVNAAINENEALTIQRVEDCCFTEGDEHLIREAAKNIAAVRDQLKKES
jgi:hypothetical protein